MSGPRPGTQLTDPAPDPDPDPRRGSVPPGGAAWTGPSQEVAVGPPPLVGAPTDIAQRYRDLVANLDENRLRAIGDRVARARAHRVAADRIRDRVAEVWKAIADPLARYGLTDPEDTLEAAREPDEVDPAAAPARAHDLCMRAMTQTAELRAVSGSGGPPPALVTALSCILTAAAVVAARIAVRIPGVGCIAAAALAVALAVALASSGGSRAVVRAGLLGAGLAGIAVLATATAHPPDPSGVVAAVVVVAVAFRFGLGIGGRRART